MAFYVRLDKVSDQAGVVRYRYTADRERFGEAELDRRSGEVRIVRNVEGASSAHIGARAAAKLRREWSKGSVPDVAEWAS